MKEKSITYIYLSLKTILILIIGIILFLSNCNVKVTKLKDKDSEKGTDRYFGYEDFEFDKMVNDIWDSKVIPYMMEVFMNH